MGGWKGEEAEGGEAGKAAAAAGGGEAQGGSPRPRAPRLPGTHQTANGCAEVYSRWRPTAPFLPPPPLRPPPLPSVLRLPDAGMGGLPTHTTIFLALGKLRARRLPEAAAAAPARRVSAPALRPERGMPSPWPARERAGSGPGWGGGCAVDRLCSLLPGQPLSPLLPVRRGNLQAELLRRLFGEGARCGEPGLWRMGIPQAETWAETSDEGTKP